MMAETSPETRWYSADVATFGDRLAGAREAAGLSQEDLAEPRGNRLQMLAGMLNVSLSWLLTAEGDGLDHPDEQPRRLGAEAEEALAELKRLRVGAIALADKLAQVERQMRQAMRKAA
jgi:transcriptional regulator with XRE-family HTH domain